MNTKHCFRFFLLLPLILLHCGNAMAQQEFQKVLKYNGQEDYMLKGAFLDLAQANISLGYVTDTLNRDLIIRTDLQGNVVWSFGMTETPTKSFRMTELATEGNAIYVAGEASDNDVTAAIHRLDENGSLIWSKGFSYTNDDITLTAITGDHQGNVAFGGTVNDVIFSGRGAVGKLSGTNGSILWTSTIDDSVEIYVDAISCTPTGEVIAAGNVSNFPNLTVTYTWLAKWSATGTLLWCKRLDPSNYLNTIVADANAIYVGGMETAGLAAGSMYVAKFTQSGNLVHWVRLNDPDTETQVQDMELTAGGVLVAAYHYDVNVGSEAPIIVMVDTALNVLYGWQDEYGYPISINGVDANGMVQYLGAYFDDPNNDEVILLGAFSKNATAAPCGWVTYPAAFVASNPVITNYAVTTGTFQGPSTVTPTTMPIVLTPLTSCTSTGVTTPNPAPLVSPNPTTGRLRLQLPAEPCKWEVIGLDGKAMLQAEAAGDTEIDLGGLPAAIYLLRIQSATDVWTTRISKVN